MADSHTFGYNSNIIRMQRTGYLAKMGIQGGRRLGQMQEQVTDDIVIGFVWIIRVFLLSLHLNISVEP